MNSSQGDIDGATGPGVQKLNSNHLDAMFSQQLTTRAAVPVAGRRPAEQIGTLTAFATRGGQSDLGSPLENGRDVAVATNPMPILDSRWRPRCWKPRITLRAYVDNSVPSAKSLDQPRATDPFAHPVSLAMVSTRYPEQTTGYQHGWPVDGTIGHHTLLPKQFYQEHLSLAESKLARQDVRKP